MEADLKPSQCLSFTKKMFCQVAPKDLPIFSKTDEDCFKKIMFVNKGKIVNYIAKLGEV